MDSNKKAFLENLEFDSQGYNDLINHIEAITHEPIVTLYPHIISINAHCTEDIISNAELEEFLKNTYNHWYRFINQHAPTDKNSKMYHEVMSARNDPRLTPEYIEKHGTYFMFFMQNFKNILTSKELRAIRDQSFFTGGFLHAYTLTNNENENTVRLYINVKTKNIIPLANEIADYCWRTNLPMHFKFNSGDYRNDPFLIYTSYENAQKYVDFLKSLHERKPQLFEGAEYHNPLLASVKDAPYIGFGEEPEYKTSSFNIERTILFKLICEERNKAIRSLWDTNTHIKTADGNLNMDDYLKRCIKQLLLKRTQDEIDKVSTEKQKFNLNQEEIAEFLRGQHNILELIKNDKFASQIDSIAEEYKEYLSREYDLDGSIMNIATLKLIVTTKNSLYAAQKPDNRVNEYKWKVFIRAQDLNEMLISLSPSLKEIFIENIHDPEVQKTYFDINHISTKHPYLNTETERELSAENSQIITR